MRTIPKSVSLKFALLTCLTCTSMPALAGKDHRVQIKVDSLVTILRKGPQPGMMKLDRHPQGTIYLNTQSETGLMKSADGGRTWTRVPLQFTAGQPNQFPSGFGITRDGRLWIVHQAPGANEAGRGVACPLLYVSSSDDHGRSWKTTQIDFGPLAPRGADDPYAIANTAWCFVNFVERPNDTLMFSTSLRYQNWIQYGQEDQSRPGIRDVMIRTTDGGKTWGDATIVHQHATETDYAVDPNNSDHILAITRKQRMVLRGEDRKKVEQETGCTPGFSYPWKGALLLESSNGGRAFREVPDSYTGFYGHRGTITWSPNNIVVVEHNDGQRGPRVARISLDGGRGWVDGTRTGTKAMNRSKKFTVAPHRSFTATIVLGPNQFLSAFSTSQGIQGKFWHLERNAGRDKLPR